MEAAISQRTPTHRSSLVRWQIGLCFLAFILIGANDAAFGVILPSMTTHYAVDKATISLLFLGGTLGYLTAALFSGVLVEKLGQQRFIMLGAAAFAVDAGLLALQPPFLSLLIILLIGGFGIGIIDAGLNAFIAGLPDNTALLNYLHAFYGVGALLGPIVASAIILQLGLSWNWVYLTWLLLALITLGGAARLFSGIKAHGEEENSGSLFAATLRYGVVWLAGAFLLSYVGAEVSLGTWGYSFLTEVRAGDPQLSAFAISAFWAGLTVGRVVLGRLAMKLGNRQAIQICLVGVVAGIVLIWVAPVGAVAAAGFILTGFSLGPIFPTTIAMISELVPARILTGAIGFAAAFGSMGAAFFPWLAGNLAQANGLWILLPYVIVLSVAMIGIWLLLTSRAKTRET